MKVIERSVQEIGKSLLITLPKAWTRLLKIRKGSVVKIMISEHGNLMIAPEFVEKGGAKGAEEAKEAVIPFDGHFQRRFFREYFGGSEKIVLMAQQEMHEERRKELYSFLKRFMNVQIIDEAKNKVTIKCFKIEELSIEECLRRMHFLLLSMIDEALSNNDKVKIEEMELTLTKFYYMLVMQVRRFLEEGKFTEENQIPLIRALDCRMAAEKIEKMADIIKNFESVKEKDIASLLGDIKEFYSKAFNNFISKDYEKALILRADEKDEMGNIMKIRNEVEKSGNIYLYKQTTGLLNFINYAKEISMLVR